MSAEAYFAKITAIIEKIQSTQMEKIAQAASSMARSIAGGRCVYLFGSGHSVLPVLDIFPRYGSFAGFVPMLDPRLMWFNIVGPGGVRELLWLERREGYAETMLKSYNLDRRDSILIFSHGGLNAASIEVAMAAKRRGLTVISVSSLENYRASRPAHSSGLKLADVSDIAIDNCVPPEDALVETEAAREKVAAGSTAAAVIIAMSLVAETAAALARLGHKVSAFVSPNVAAISPDHNEKIFQAYARLVREVLD